MAILDDVKLSLRVSNAAYNTEVTDLIAAAKLDLEITGIDSAKITDTDSLIKRAIILYCKANFGYDNKDADRLMESYVMLKTHLSVSTDYHTYPVTE